MSFYSVALAFCKVYFMLFWLVPMFLQDNVACEFTSVSVNIALVLTVFVTV